PADDAYPSWSPDGSRLVFDRRSDSDTDTGLYVVNADGTGLRGIERAPRLLVSGDPSWAHDGRILFDGDLLAADEVATVNPDGSGLATLTNNRSDDDDPNWSPEGARMAFESG